MACEEKKKSKGNQRRQYGNHPEFLSALGELDKLKQKSYHIARIAGRIGSFFLTVYVD
jgi:hypothetical protein